MQTLRRNMKDPMALHMADGGVTRWANGLRMADGGNYHKGSMNGGRVVGPGTGVSDSVPAKYSNGEYVLPADTAAAIGHDRLDAIKDATHTPAAVQHGLRGGQTVHMAEGGGFGLEPYVNHRDYVAPPVPTLAQFPEPKPNFTAGNAPIPDYVPPRGIGGTPANAVATTPYQPNFAPPNSDTVSGQGTSQRGFDNSAASDATVKQQPRAPRPMSSMSPEAQVYNAERTGPFQTGTPTAAEAAPTTLRGKASSFLGSSFNNLTSAVKTVGPSLLAGVAGGAAASAVRTLGDPSKSPGQPQDIGAASQIPTGGDGAAPPAQPYNFYTDNEVGRNIGNTLTASQPFGGSVGAGLRALNTGGKITAGLAGVSDLAGAAGMGAAANIQSQRAAAANPAAAPAAPVSSPGVLTPGDATMPGQDPGRGPLLRGMSGTDLPGAQGVSKFTQDGKTLYSNVSTPGDNDALMNGRAGVSTMPGMSQQAIDAVLGGRSAGQTSADNQIRAANLRDGVDSERGIGGNTGGVTSFGESGGYGLLSKEYQAKRADDMAMGDVNNQSRTLRGQTLGFMSQQAENASRMAIAASGDATTRRGQDITGRNSDVSNRLTARGQDITERDNMRTNDTSLRNNKMNNDFNAGKFQVEIGQKDREFGASQKAADMTARSASENQLQKNLESQFRTTDDKGNNVPDQDKIGQYRTAVSASLPTMIKQLQNVGSSTAMAKAKELQDRGPSALDDSDHARFKTLFGQRDRFAEARGVLPGSGSFKQSDDLFDFQQKPGAAGVEKRSMGGNRIVTNNGTSASYNDLRYAKGPANKLFPDVHELENTNITRGLRRE